MIQNIAKKLKTKTGKAYLTFFTVFWSGTLIFFLYNTKAVLGDAEERAPWVPYLYAGVIIVICVCAFLCTRKWANSVPAPEEEKKDQSKRLRPRHIIIAAALSGWWFLSIELINNTDGLLEMELKYVVANIGGFFIMACLLFLFLNSVKATLIILTAFFGYADLVFYFVYLFRGEPFQLMDIFSAGTGFEVASHYEFVFSIWGVVMTTISLVIIGCLFHIKDGCFAKRFKGKIMMRALGVILMVAGYFLYLYTPWNGGLDIVTDLWAPKKTYTQVGTNLGFFCVAKFMVNDKPDGYSIRVVEDIIERSEEEGAPERAQVDTTPVNIIVVMNESWADYRHNGEFETSKEFMSYYDSMVEDTVKGVAMVCISGGGTAKTEYEFLTGNSVKQYPGLVPYVNFYSHDQYSIVSTLKSQGYEAIAIHPSKGTNWRRNIAYDYLGFDEFLTINDFTDPKLIRGMVSDLSDYQKIVELIESKEDPSSPLFIFNVTMQNHGGYATDNYTITVDVEGFEEETGETERYLSLLRASDEALEYLVEALKEVEEPTMLVMFGDHYPNLPDFETYLSGDEADNLDVYDRETYYEVPFFIWTNYDIEEKTDLVTSTNFLSVLLYEEAGLEVTPFDEYRMQLLTKMSGYNHLGYYDTNGNFIPWDDDTAEIENLVWEYECLQYNALKETANRKDDFFTLSER